MNWRIMARWRDGRAFHVVGGESREECMKRLKASLSDYTREELDDIGEAWNECWVGSGWSVQGSVSLRGLKLSRTMKEKTR